MIIDSRIIEKLSASGVIVDEELFDAKWQEVIEGMHLVDYPIPDAQIDEASSNLATIIVIGMEIGAITLGGSLAVESSSSALAGLGLFLSSWGGAALGGTSMDLLQQCKILLRNS